MRVLKLMIVIPALVLMAASCGPHRPCMSHHGGKDAMMMPHGCSGPEACTYRSRCFSNGAVQTNGGVCQACSAGKWVAASGCSTDDHPCGGCHDCGDKKGKKSEPCHHHGKPAHTHDH